MDAERRLLDYLWNTALIERLRVAGNDGKVAVHVRDLFGPDDPLTADIDSALAAPAYRCPVEGFHEHRFDGPHGLAAPAVTETGDLDLYAIDRLLAIPHREDDEPCSCDECMSYGAEDAGADWYRIPAANRIAMRILDGADTRFARLARAFHDHASAVTETADANWDPWLADILRCGEAALERWTAVHRKDDGSLAFSGHDGSFFEGIRSVVQRLRDYHFQRSKDAALAAVLALLDEEAGR